MKNIKEIREQFDYITEKEEKEEQKLAALVRAGLFDAKKLPALKKALEKSPDKMTGQEKRILINLLDSLISQVLGDQQVYRKVKQNVQHDLKEAEDHLSKFDPKFKTGYPKDKDIPSVLILKRKAIRVYPDNQKVALYYSQVLDKYVTIPFNDIQLGLNEENMSDEEKKKYSSYKSPKVASYFRTKYKKGAKEALSLLKSTGEYAPAKRFKNMAQKYGIGSALGIMIHDRMRKLAIKKAMKNKSASRAGATQNIEVPNKTAIQEKYEENLKLMREGMNLTPIVKIGSKIGGEAISWGGKVLKKGREEIKKVPGYLSRLKSSLKNKKIKQKTPKEEIPKPGVPKSNKPRIGGVGGLAGAATGVAAALSGSGSGSGKDDETTKHTYQFGNIKPTIASSFQQRADQFAARNERMRQIAVASQKAMMREENVLATIKKVAKGELNESKIIFDEKEITINNTVAKKMMKIYESMNAQNKKKMETMLNESASSFNKVLTFAIRQ